MDGSDVPKDCLEPRMDHREAASTEQQPRTPVNLSPTPVCSFLRIFGILLSDMGAHGLLTYTNRRVLAGVVYCGVPTLHDQFISLLEIRV